MEMLAHELGVMSELNDGQVEGLSQLRGASSGASKHTFGWSLAELQAGAFEEPPALNLERLRALQQGAAECLPVHESPQGFKAASASDARRWMDQAHDGLQCTDKLLDVCHPSELLALTS